MRADAGRYNAKAARLKDQGRVDEAIEQYRKAIKADPRWSVPWYNLGLIYKYQRHWADSLECNRKAAKFDPTDGPAWWNMGIAATALGDWAEARRAWAGFGIELPPGDGPIEMKIGLTPIRLNPDTEPEVVWCQRIDPARAIIDNIPLPESEHRYGDLLLHDGAPMGTRKLHDHEVPVFNELQILEQSEFGTYEASIDGATSKDVELLVELAHEQNLAAEDWSANIRRLCKACSEGRPFDDEHKGEHNHDRAPGPMSDRRIAIAALREEKVHHLLELWREKAPHAEIVAVECALLPAYIN